MNSIPQLHAPLSVEQIRTMEQRHIKKHHVAIILLHWFNAIVWFIELATGIALISSPVFSVAPQWYTEMLRSAFGASNLLRFHIVLGVVWITVFAVYGIFGYRNYLHHEVLTREIGLDKDDFQWLRIRTLHLLNRSAESLPPQGVYNAGQKLFALLVYAALPVIAVTGVIMGFHLFTPAVISWAMLLHFVSVGMVVSGLMIHVYMGAVFPEERPAFFSMITGVVNELYAYKHHYKWWKEVKAAQQQWESEVAQEEESSENGRPTVA